ncbi:MAG: Flp family type IVb pilin [Dehalococcoidia bacterium]|jgi:Flp pilus assembly pilin Flp
MLDKLVVKLLTWINDDHGQDMVEYVIITGGIAVALVAALAIFTPFISGWFSAMGAFFQNIAPQ